MINKSIEATKKGFEASFMENDYYNKQTQDDKHLRDILAFIDIKPGMKVLDLGCGSGYLTFPMAEYNPQVTIVGLDIVTNTLKKNQEKKTTIGLHNVDCSFDSDIRFPKKKDTAFGYEEVLAKHDREIIKSYDLTETEDEIWVTEEVNNLLFKM